ncbi:benzoate 4-monooxygenase cytochrome P450 [Xylaria arbuscula]|nr:benzoate 4-monooxygenase cytochrome P450 [Xylaria arbuscula]
MAFLNATFAIIKCILLLVVSYHITLFTYRFFLHPLKNYPGPSLAKLTDLYGGVQSFKRRLHLKTWQDHRQYGPVVRQGPNKLIFNSVAAARDIYLSDGVSKAQCYQAGNVNPSMTNVFNTIDKHVHRVKRRHVSLILTDRSVGMFEPKVDDQVTIFLREILSTCQNALRAPINMSKICKYLGLDIAGYLGFGYALNTQTDPTHRFLVNAMMIGSWRLNMYIQSPALRKLRLEVLFYALAVLSGKSFLQVLSKMIQSRLSKETDAEHDLYAFMARTPKTSEADGVTAKEIWNEGMFFLPAAGDTTSTVLSMFSSSSEIESPRLQNCQYLRACIYEALRMSPPIPGTLWREQLPSNAGKPFVVYGYAIPPGVQVGVNVYTIHHNPDYFPDPFTYNPDRWIPSKGEEATLHSEDQNTGLKHNPAFMPFSLGGRACAGRSMAYAELSLAIAKTMWYFDFEFPSEIAQRLPTVNEATGIQTTEFNLLDVFTSSHNGPYLSFRLRGDYWKDLVGVHQ